MSKKKKKKQKLNTLHHKATGMTWTELDTNVWSCEALMISTGDGVTFALWKRNPTGWPRAWNPVVEKPSIQKIFKWIEKNQEDIAA